MDISALEDVKPSIDVTSHTVDAEDATSEVCTPISSTSDCAYNRSITFADVTADENG